MPAGIVPALLRTRPVVSGESFSVHASVPEAVHVRGMLIIAVPKRNLRRAVDRNAVRRVAREAWRALALDRSAIVAMLRMKRAPAVQGARARKLAVRAELDRLFGALRRRVAEGRVARPERTNERANERPNERAGPVRPGQ